MPPKVAPLDRQDPAVVAARTAEREAYARYGLDAADHLIEVPALGCTIRVVVVGSGHLPWLDETATCGELIRDFLDTRT